jgi:hypothetical protein
MMYDVDQLKHTLIKRLKKKGIEQSIIPGFMRSLANAVFVCPYVNHLRVNRRLHYLGWLGVELDYRTLELALACFEGEGLGRLESKSDRWFQDNF